MLTAAQKTAFKTNRNANTTSIQAFVAGQGDTLQSVQIKDVLEVGSNYQKLADWYNGFASPDYFVWDSVVPVDSITDNITGANYDPSDAPDNTVTFQNRMMVIEEKLIGLQILLQGRETFNAGKKNLRAWLNSATTNIPSGTSGASRSGGWNVILPILSRKANNTEKLFAVDDGPGIGNTVTDARGLATNPDLAVFEGTISESDVRDALLNG